MAVPTFIPKKNTNISQVLIYIFAILGIGLLVYFGANVIKNFGNLKGKSGLSVSVLHGEAEVHLNGEFLGATPFESRDIKSGENKIKVKNSDVSYNVSLDFSPNSEIAMNRDLGISDVFSSGQNFWLKDSENDTVLSIISEPAGAKVFVDNTQLGTTPYSTNSLTKGEYDLRVEIVGYETQTARIKIQEGYLLNVALKMFPLPVPTKIDLLEGSTSLYDINSSDSIVNSNSEEWVKAIIYWNQTRGINLADTGMNKELMFDYFLDYSGNIFDKEGNKVTEEFSLEDFAKGAYLRRVSEGEGLTEAAREVLKTLDVVSGKQGTIKTTGTGWLNVRSEPGLNGEILTKVDVGDVFAVLEEGTGWVKLKVSDTVEGWVSSTYVTVSED